MDAVELRELADKLITMQHTNSLTRQDRETLAEATQALQDSADEKDRLARIFAD